MKSSSIAAICKKHGIEPPKTAAQIKAEHRKAAKALPSEVKRTFWAAMREGKTLGEARIAAGIDDVMVAAELYLACHEKITYHRPMEVSGII